MILFGLTTRNHPGYFVAVDTVSRIAHVAFPSSDYAESAKSNPALVAVDMFSRAYASWATPKAIDDCYRSAFEMLSDCDSVQATDCATTAVNCNNGCIWDRA